MKARHKDTGEIIELAEEGIISRDGRRFCWYQVELIPEPIDECKPSLPSNLDEAARHYLLNEHCSPLNEIMHQADVKAEMTYHKDIESAFKAGVEWMTGQGVTTKGFVNYGSGGAYVVVETDFLGTHDTEDYDDGEEVVVQVRKIEEESK